MIVMSGPGVAAFVGWAIASWLITGEAFAPVHLRVRQ